MSNRAQKYTKCGVPFMFRIANDHDNSMNMLMSICRHMVTSSDILSMNLLLSSKKIQQYWFHILADLGGKLYKGLSSAVGYSYCMWAVVARCCRADMNSQFDKKPLLDCRPNE